MMRDWRKLYLAQDEILKILSNVDNIFLGGGTAIQRFLLKKPYRQSEDLDFFLPIYDAELIYKANMDIYEALRSNSNIDIKNRVNSLENGVDRYFCEVKNYNEAVKIELVHCTDMRIKDKYYNKCTYFPRVENGYNLILYKLKALHDRQDTIKDLFDLYFLLREVIKEDIDINELFSDMQMKFKHSTGYNYGREYIVEALEAKYRQNDIISLCKNDDIYNAIDEFRLDFIDSIKTGNKLNFSYEARLSNKLKIYNFCENLSHDECYNIYYNTIEENSFIAEHANSLKQSNEQAEEQPSIAYRRRM